MIRLRAEEDWPIGIGDFGDIDVAARIQRDAVRGDELAQSLADRLSAEMGQDFPLRGHNREPRPEIGYALGERRHSLRAELADHRDRLFAPRDEETAGAHEIVPLGLIFAVAVEDLHAMIFAIGDVDPALVIAGDIVDEIELPRIGPRLAPGEQQFTVRRILVNAGVGIAVRDVDIALR